LRDAIVDRLARFRRGDGSYELSNEYRYVIAHA
jgi:hypothetical protein